MHTDPDLLEAWAAGDREAGSALLRRYFEPLYRFFASKVEGGVEDLIQTTLTTCSRRRDALRDAASFRAYVFTVARHELYRYFRQRARGRDVAPIEESALEDLGVSPATMLAKQAEQRLLLRALRRVPLRMQLLVELHYWEGLSTQEVAEVLEIPQGTVKSRLHTARGAIERKMKELCESPTVLESSVAGFEAWAKSLRDVANPA